jgi:hypothetical protein
MTTTTRESIAVINTATGALKDSVKGSVTRIYVSQGEITQRTRPFVASGALHGSNESVLRGEEYPVLARIWNNDSDAIFDNL